MDIREKRKWQHLKYTLQIEDGPLDPGFRDVALVHQALGSFDIKDIDTNMTLFHKELKFPLLINAMTGGADGLEQFNKIFAIAARECGIALAVGSQTAAIKNPATRNTFKIVRELNPQGLIFANVSALVNPQEALEAVEMIEADALQLHLNLAQELAMGEGDRAFKGTLENILQIKTKVKVPVIIKEVGFGLSRETVNKLYNEGLKNFDVGGAGGTNFAAIEQKRNPEYTNPDLINWGIPTVISLLEAKSVANDLNIFATGGLRTAKDILISLVLGAKIAGLAAPILSKAKEMKEDILIFYLEGLIREVKELMLLINAPNLREVKKSPVIITGYVGEWLRQRGLISNNTHGCKE
ncbi:MAG: type 2 isopentenyl-diphosphate Delta-isomerase [Clostridia bacterium]|nr:type 2 isopentenyl-diphosphate Delta-isomerase [Clostridia bacterium]